MIAAAYEQKINFHKTKNVIKRHDRHHVNVLSAAKAQN